MKAKLKYPIFSFTPKGNMIYVFWEEELHQTTNIDLLKKKKNYIVVDSTGTKYVETGAHMVKWKGIAGYFTGMHGRVISIEYEYEDCPEPFSLRQLQERVVFMPRPLTLRARIARWLHPTPQEKKIRIKMLLFWIIYLTVCYLIFEWQN